MTNTEFLGLLNGLRACEEAVAWVAARDLEAAWRDCDKVVSEPAMTAPDKIESIRVRTFELMTQENISAGKKKRP